MISGPERLTARTGRLVNRPSRGRRGFSLLELILSLALSAVVAGMIGSLVQLYLINQNSGRDQVKQAQMARAILNMIAEDIRTTVRHQPFDASGLSQLIGGEGGGASGGGSGNSGPTGSSTLGSSPPASGATAPGSNSSGTTTGSNQQNSSSTSAVALLPPGIYGSSTSIEIDVSRLPRPDEYFSQGNSMVTGTLSDLPSDIKTVGYYVQAMRADGVNDPLAGLTNSSDKSSSAGMSGGLVRRSVDRAVTQYAYQKGLTDSLLRTGELIAPEVVAIEFEYFDGSSWQYNWDSSQLALPHVVKIIIAIQKESSRATNPIEPGFTISSMSASTLKEYGIEVYSLNTLIPGAQLLTGPNGGTNANSGMNSMGIQ